MSETTEARHGFLLALLALCLLAMLLASLWQRFMHPSLVVNKLPTPAAVAASEGAGGMTAIGPLMEAVGRNPQDRVALTGLVERLMAARQWPAAENFAQRLLALDAPDHEMPRSLFLMAVINHNQGRHAQAAELFERLLSREEDPSARFSLALIYLHFLDKIDEGIQQLEKGLAAPDLPGSLADAMREELESARNAREQKRASESKTVPGTGASDGGSHPDPAQLRQPAGSQPETSPKAGVAS